MSNLLKSLRIFWQIQIVSAVALIGFVAIMTLYLIIDDRRADAQHEANAATHSEILVKDVRYGFLNARRREKDFLLRLDEKYVVDHGGVVASVEKSLMDLERAEGSQTLEDEIADVRNGFAN